jgi:hypothetical protein
VTIKPNQLCSNTVPLHSAKTKRQFRLLQLGCVCIVNRCDSVMKLKQPLQMQLNVGCFTSQALKSGYKFAFSTILISYCKQIQGSSNSTYFHYSSDYSLSSRHGNNKKCWEEFFSSRMCIRCCEFFLSSRCPATDLFPSNEGGIHIRAHRHKGDLTSLLFF